ncbi:hypothetical protein LMG7053_02042 [Achromobacter ruhlandii]|uniref:ESPR domain-containing protein n=1 Tax=Achromobacter ruhlandii TaxID=72557 RepID=A0ABM8LTL5_9BURK|nr:hypothetical protein LMG7053_02042 [Achromobacter ruhlandii]
MDRRQALRQGDGQGLGPALEHGAQLRQAMLLALLPAALAGPFAAQQRQRVVADGVAQAQRVAMDIARQDQAEAQQREGGRQHPRHGVIGEVLQRVVHGVVGRGQRVEGHQVGQSRQRRRGRAGGIDARQPEQRQRQRQQREAVQARQHAEGAEPGGRHRVQCAAEKGAGAGRRVAGGGQQRAVGPQHQQHHVALRPAGVQPEQAGKHDGAHRAQAVAQRAGIVTMEAHGRARRRRPRRRQGRQAVQRHQVGVHLFAQPVGGDQQRGLVPRVRAIGDGQRFRQLPAGLAQQTRRARRVALPQRLGCPVPGLLQRRPQRRQGRAERVVAGRRGAAHQSPEQRRHAVADGGGALRQVFGLGLAGGQQVVHAVYLGDHVLPCGLRLDGRGVLLARDRAGHAGGQPLVLRMQPGAQGAGAEQAADQAQADGADHYGGAASHDVLEGVLGVAHGAVGGQADGVAGHHRARRAEMAQQRHGADAQPEPGAEAQDEQQRHLAGHGHQCHGRQHADQCADDAPGALADDGALHRIDHQQHGGGGRERHLQFQQVGHAQRQQGGGGRAGDVGAAGSDQVQPRQQGQRATEP